MDQNEGLVHIADIITIKKQSYGGKLETSWFFMCLTFWCTGGKWVGIKFLQLFMGNFSLCLTVPAECRHTSCYYCAAALFIRLFLVLFILAPS